MAKIIWTKWAIKDLKAIFDYISLDSKFYASRFVNTLIHRVDQLYLQPNSGRIVPEKGDNSIRELIEGNYRIFYKISNSKIIVLRIHNSARKIKS